MGLHIHHRRKNTFGTNKRSENKLRQRKQGKGAEQQDIVQPPLRERLPVQRTKGLSDSVRWTKVNHARAPHM